MSIHCNTDWDGKRMMSEEDVEDIVRSVRGNGYVSPRDGKRYYGPMVFAILGAADQMALNVFNLIDCWRRDGEVEPLDVVAERFFASVPPEWQAGKEIARRVISAESQSPG